MRNIIKSLILLLIIIGITFGCMKDQKDTIIPIEKGQFIDTIMYDGIDRRYMAYVPQSYDGDEAVPLLLYFHCARSVLENPDPLMFVDDTWTFDEIAENEGFIFIAPQSLKILDEGSGKEWWIWNEDMEPAPRPDDVGFVNALIDSISVKYNIDNERIYASGYSWGAFFSFALACDLSDRIAAIAGVSGYMRPSYLNQCNPTRPVPVLQIHGNKDPVVLYIKNQSENPGVQPTLDFWIGHNQTSIIPIIDTVDVNLNDNYIREYFKYLDGVHGSAVEHIKVREATHSWDIFNGSKEINAPEEFWKFLSQYNINGKIE